MSTPTIRHEITDRVATVWLHRPHRHNAWTGRMHTEFRATMAELEADDDVRVVVVTGTPPAFCVGGDSDALAGHADKGGYDTGLPPEPARPGVAAPGLDPVQSLARGPGVSLRGLITLNRRLA